MSTLFSLAVVAVAILGVLRIALKDPDQPATVRPPNRRREPLPAPGAAMSARRSAARAVAVGEGAVAGGFRAPATGDTAWTRLRSGMALVVLVAVVGAMLALAVGAALVGGALALRSAVS